MEVETPLLGSYTVTESNIESFSLRVGSDTRYLQTSPEYAMKRLLSSGSGDIYQICKSFRAKESGVNHNPEFSLVEWYRLDFDLQQIMQETVLFISELLSNSSDAIYVSYSDATREVFGTSMLEMSESQIQTIAAQHGMNAPESLSLTQLQDFTFANIVAPTFAKNKLTVVFHYPALQASLAKLSDDNPGLAQRFEIFYGDLELANGFVELTDADEQLARFKTDQENRMRNGLPRIEVDQRLITAMKHGLPSCAGVAVGFDRIVMLVTNAECLREVVSFDWESA